MPERLARIDGFTQVPEAIGSGPYRFLPEERVPGARLAYARHAGYAPRPDGVASLTAGPRVAHLDRVEFHVIPNAATAAAALQAGAVDWVEQPLIDLLPALRRSRDIAVEVKDSTGLIGHLRFNHLHPPFDNPALERLREAWFDAPDLAGQRAVSRQIQAMALDLAVFVPLGQFVQPVAYRRALTDMPNGPPLFTGVRKRA